MGDRPTNSHPTEHQRPILVTGFGPFHHHVVNASWVAVQELKQLGVEHNSQQVPLEIREVVVAYDVVSTTIPRLYKEVSPRLCVHVGVSPYKCVKLERVARNRGYTTVDIKGKTPSSLACVSEGPDLICTTFNVDSVCRSVSQKQLDVKFDVSGDAGRYLCDFIYYQSLHQEQAPVIFVHVPELDKPYSVDQLALALKNIIEALLKELESAAEKSEN